MSRRDGKLTCSEFSGFRRPPPAVASEDRRGGGSFLDEMGLELDKWDVGKQEGRYSPWEEDFYLLLDNEIDFSLGESLTQ